ncbi:Transketolase, thiamine diphosphate binding domain-containing protein [Limtongia smithiae]|uniref:Transketolase, thiamine diphosphate binding domain-containing protein n=1 Tax=Limtongia smithiae TaxID=1125753 RepID=UPI0034CDFF0C
MTLSITPTTAPDAPADEAAVRELRKLVIDCCRQNGGGHGGSAVGMAPLAVALWKHILRYNPAAPNWIDRDRFVLSNGHAAILLYAVLHVTGYKKFTMEELRGYAAPKEDNKEYVCFAHPEIEFDGVEVTTGPLGQGIANAVGMAIANKQLAATYNKPGYELFQGKIFCSTGDGCLQEGVAAEAMAIAGHMGLDNLILLYDNNDVTCDGPLKWIMSEDVNAKARAMGWRAIDVFDGDTSVQSIVNAIALAKTYTGKPTIINIRTTIGYNTGKAGTAGAHHGTFSDEDLIKAGGTLGVSHHVSQEVYEDFALSASRGAAIEHAWQDTFASYALAYPQLARELQARLSGTPTYDLDAMLASVVVPAKLTAAREINGDIFNQIFHAEPRMFSGGADLWGANKLGASDHVVFEPPTYSGRVARYGIREHAMAAVSNGIAAFQPGVFIPTTATFLMFYLYAAPAVRMGALNTLQVIHVATHDSFQEGQNGPTHQPVEVDSLYRAMPNMHFIRPADGEEIIAAWGIALGAQHMSSIISVARDAQEFPPKGTCRIKARRGGYVLSEVPGAVVTLVSCGSELGYVLAASTALTEAGIPTRVVSMPCMSVFDAQPESYKESVLGVTERIISAEEYVPTTWAKYCTASIGMSTFGYSASGKCNYARFGLDVAGIVGKVTKYVAEPFSPRWKKI